MEGCKYRDLVRLIKTLWLAVEFKIWRFDTFLLIPYQHILGYQAYITIIKRSLKLKKLIEYSCLSQCRVNDKSSKWA